MPQAIVITPVKDSLETTKATIRSVSQSHGDFLYYIFNDFSTDETTAFLEEHQEKYNYQLINLSEITDTPSPNYRLVLQQAQKMALENNLPLVIIESDVEVAPNTLSELINYEKSLNNCGMVAAITIDWDGNINFPYLNYKSTKNDVISTKHSLSFCCTLLSTKLLCQYDFSELSQEKHWYDVFISRKSIQLGLYNYLVTSLKVLHKPHSSRPWKQMKYKNPVKYYYKKLVKRLDRI